MKKSKIITTVVAAALSASVLGGALVGCSNQTGKGEKYVFEYEISVVGGTGGGTLKDGENCTVTADVPEGKVFDKWVNEYGEVLSTVNPYTFKVDGDMEIHAVVADSETYRIEVVGGTITGTDDYVVNAYKGQKLSVTAHSSQSHKFVKWIINGTEESTKNPYEFTANADMKIQAVVDESYLIAVSGGTIAGGDIRKIFNGGDECTITAEEAPQGQTFVYWYVLDEDQNEVRVSDASTYTFTVTGTDKYYAKFGKTYTLSVTGGTVNGENSANIIEGESATVSLDVANIPAGKGFVGWKFVGDDTVLSDNLTYEIRDISADIQIQAVFGDLVHEFATPGNDANQMFKFNSSYTVEFDRNGAKTDTEFKANVEYIMYYFYTSPYADKNDYVGRIKMVKGSNRNDNAGNKFGAEFITLDGEYVTGVKGALGDLYIDHNFIGASKKDTMFAILKAAIGDDFDSDTPYYVAAQTCGKEYSVYAPSDISVIGPQVFIEGTAPATSTVTVTGGTVKNAGASTVTVYNGQQITVVCDVETFAGWVINGDGENIVAENPYTFTVTADTTVAATYEGDSTVTVEGGTLEGGTTSGSYPAGTSVTVTANPAESGKAFAYWYTLDGENEKKVSESAEYTFTVTVSVTLYAKYANAYKLAVNGGVVEGLDKNEDGTYTVLETGSYTVKIDLSAIPEGKGFTGWKMGDKTVSGNSFVIAAGEITADTTVEAQYAELIHEFTAPKMDNNESFRPRKRDGDDDYALEMARGGALFSNPNVSYIKFYIYTSPYADKTEYVGAFKLDNVGGFRLATMSGEKLYGIEGSDGNLWLETKDSYNNPSTKVNCGKMFAKILGDKYDANTPYYLAAQACGVDGGLYAPSDISVIGPKEFIFGTVPAKYTVTVTGGSIKNSSANTVTVFDGQKITVVCASDAFSYWTLNGEKVESEGNTYTFTVTGNAELAAVLEGMVTVTVTGGSIKDGGETSITVESGTSVTVVADQAAAGKVFAYWYVMVDGKEEVLSENAEYTFEVASSTEVIAKFANTYTLTVTGGAVEGLTPTEGKYTVLDTKAYTLKADADAIPAGKYFAGWKIGDSVISTTNLDYTLAAGTISADTTVEAVYKDQIKLDTPVNGNNEMFKVTDSGTIELDRKNKGVQSEFDNPDIEYMLFYFYTSPYIIPTADNAAGSIKLMRVKNGSSESFYFAKLDGTKIWDVKGRKSDLYQDETCGTSSKKEALFLLIKAAMGDNYDANTAYYVAMKSFCKEGGMYTPSDISAIGPQAYVYNNVAQYTLTIDGGVIQNTELSTATLYAGQSVTVVPSRDNFVKWLVNGEEATDNPLTVTVTENTTVKAVYGGESTVTVEGGTVTGDATVENGTTVTITPNEAAENMYFAYWYILEGETEKILSYESTYSFEVTEDVTVKAKFGKLLQVTVTGGTIEGLTAAEGVYTVRQFDQYVLKLDLTAIPEGQGFTKWNIGENTLTESFEYTFASGYFTDNAAVTAVYAQKQKLDVTLSMASGTEMIRRNDAYTIDIDRCYPNKSNTAFQANVDHVKLYIYTDSAADKSASVGILVIDLKGAGNKPRFATENGETLWILEGSPANIWLDTANNYSADRRGNFRKILQQCIGEAYDAGQSYYFAAQACGKVGSIYDDGDICDIGAQAF